MLIETSSSRSQSMDRDAVLRLDECITRTARIAGEHLDELAMLLTEAKAGDIHQYLGFPSWTAYLADRLQPITRALDTDARRELVLERHQAGMSVRAVAETVGMSKSSVGREVSQTGTGAEPHSGEGADCQQEQTTGLDGNTYPRRRNGGGGHRGPQSPRMRLRSLRTSIHNVAGLPEEAETLRDRICEQMDQLIASLTAQPVELDVAVGNG